MPAKKYKVRFIAAGVLFFLTLLFIQLAKLFPQQTELWYARGWFRIVSRIMIGATSWVPISLAEFILILFVLGLVIDGILWVRSFLKTKTVRNKRQQLFALLSGAALLAAGLCFAFVLLGGLNYHRLTFTHYSGLDIRASTVDELAGLCESLADRANALRPLVQENEGAVMRLSEDFAANARYASEAYGKLAQQYDGILDNGALARPKPVLLSKLMSYSQITGGYFFYTFEPNINTHAPDYLIPATMAHELAHSCGFMREDEANYIAYLACGMSDNIDFQYSGVMLAMIHSLNALHSVDTERYQQVYDRIAPAIWWDMQAASHYWAAFESSYGDFADKVNDVYLKANSQTDGVRSYGRMVDLLLAEYRAMNAV